MAFYTETKTHGFTERLLAAAAQILNRSALRLAHYRIYSTTLAELRGLSDRDLNDLGLNRSMLMDLARQAADSKVKL